MALANTIRRTASRVVPLAIRASPGSQRYHHHCSALFDAVKTHGDLLRKLFPRSFSVSVHHYSTKRPSSSESSSPRFSVPRSPRIMTRSDAWDHIDHIWNVPKHVSYGIKTVFLLIVTSVLAVLSSPRKLNLVS